MPTAVDRYAASSLPVIAARSLPPAWMRPELGRSSPPIKFRSVDLPDPDLPKQRHPLAPPHLERNAAKRAALPSAASRRSWSRPQPARRSRWFDPSSLWWNAASSASLPRQSITFSNDDCPRKPYGRVDCKVKDTDGLRAMVPCRDRPRERFLHRSKRLAVDSQGYPGGASRRSLTQRLSFDESLSFFAPIGAMVNSDGLPAGVAAFARMRVGPWSATLGLPAFWRTRLRRLHPVRVAAFARMRGAGNPGFTRVLANAATSSSFPSGGFQPLGISRKAVGVTRPH